MGRVSRDFMISFPAINFEVKLRHEIDVLLLMAEILHHQG